MSDHHDDGDEFEWVSQALSGLPIVNQVLDRLGLPALLAGALGEDDARLKLAPAVAIRLVVANLVLGREPLYGLGEWAAGYDPGLRGLGAGDVAVLNDDRVGRALEALFDADRASRTDGQGGEGRRVRPGAERGPGDRLMGLSRLFVGVQDARPEVVC